VDPRRQNLSEESLKANVERLKDYLGRVIVFPRQSGKFKKGDGAEEEVKKASKGEGIVTGKAVSTGLPIKNVAKVTEAKTKDEKSHDGVYRALRDARSEARLVGVREKRAKAKAEEKADAKK
jgi:large subunit ribosomal protein L13e